MAYKTEDLFLERDKNNDFYLPEDELILSDVGIDAARPWDQKCFERGLKKVDELARARGFNPSDKREFLQGACDRMTAHLFKENLPELRIGPPKAISRAEWQRSHDERSGVVMHVAGLDENRRPTRDELAAGTEKIRDYAQKNGVDIGDAGDFLKSVTDRRSVVVSAREHFTTMSYRYDGNASDISENCEKAASAFYEEERSMTDEEVMRKAELSTEAPANERELSAATSRVERQALGQGFRVEGTEQFLREASERYFNAAQSREVSRKATNEFFARGEKTHASAADDSNAQLNALEARRASEAQSRQGSRLSI